MENQKFKFGENWKAYSRKLNKNMYFKAKSSVRDIAGDMRGKNFLDIGSGSGIFSIAASGLGAGKVIGVDIDPLSVETSKENIEAVLKWDRSVNKDTIFFTRRSILEDCSDLGEFDIVYSWGVLHHTGNMYKAIKKASERVRPEGKFIISIYNKHFTSPCWKNIKKLYNKSPVTIKKIIFGITYIIKFTGIIFTQGRMPFKKDRGMSFYFDVRDWIGGYPYEYASIDEIVDFLRDIGFKTSEVRKTKGFTGCNEFIFMRYAQKDAKCAE